MISAYVLALWYTTPCSIPVQEFRMAKVNIFLKEHYFLDHNKIV